MGFLLVLPASLYVAFLLTLLIIKASQHSQVGINLSYIPVALSSALAMLFVIPGIVVGNDEAMQYFFRLLACLVAGLGISSFARRGDIMMLRSFLQGVITVAFLNATFVIATALTPGLYDALHIRDISGFDKNMRQFRSPGFFRGFDTSGYFIITAICATPLMSHFRDRPAVSTLSLALLSLAVLLSSRSSMLLLGVAMLLILVLYRGNLPVIYKIAALIVSAAFGLLGFAFAASIFGFTSWDWIDEFFAAQIGSGIDSIYSVNSEIYLSHLDVTSVQLLPYQNGLTPDNFFTRSLLATGGIGMMGIIVHILYMALSSIMAHKGELKVFSILFCVFYFLFNIKNNYMLFVPYYSIMCFIFYCRPRRWPS